MEKLLFFLSFVCFVRVASRGIDCAKDEKLLHRVLKYTYRVYKRYIREHIIIYDLLEKPQNIFAYRKAFQTTSEYYYFLYQSIHNNIRDEKREIGKE